MSHVSNPMTVDINEKTMLAHFNNNHTLAKKVIDTCLADLPVYIYELKEAITKHDSDVVKLRCHSIKNKARHFQQKHFASVLADLECTTPAQKQLDDAQSQLADITRGVYDLMVKLQKLRKLLHETIE